MMLLLALSCLVSGAASSSNFLVTPMPMTVTTGFVSEFNCSADADAVSFRVNGTSVNVLDNPDIVTISLPGMEPRLHMLHIIANEEYNNTRVQCIATNFSSGLIIFSNETVLIIQGLLPSVGNLTAISGQSSILLTWIPPFSLDITGVDPDIKYCVEVYNTTSANSTIDPIANYSVLLPNFNFTLDPPNPCYEFEFRVIPINGVGNGNTSAPAKGYFLTEPESVHQIDVVVAVRDLVFMVNISFKVDVR